MVNSSLASKYVAVLDPANCLFMAVVTICAGCEDANVEWYSAEVREG